MAVTITDTRTTIDGADTTTGWSSPVNGDALSIYTTDPAPVEASGSIGMAVSIETSDLVHTHTSTDLSGGRLVYVWVLANGTMDTIVNGGVALIMGDGTDTIGYHLAGSDAAAFRHESGPVGWQCLLLDSTSLPTNFTAYRGSEASLTWASITEFGAGYKTLSKALGGTENCFTDIIRYGNDGIRITAGTSGSPGLFSEIAIEDRDSTSGKAYGIIRELGEGLLGLQGPLTFGDTAGVGTTYFADTNATVAFEDRGIGTNYYYITIQGNAIGATTFQLGTKVGAAGGRDGCSLICPAGVGATFTATDTDLQNLYIYGSSLSGFENGISFSADATNGPTHEVYGNTFSGNGQIDPAQVLFKNNSVIASTDFATGAVLLDADGTADWSDLTFTSGGTGHAIYITTAGTYNFTSFTYSGYSTPTVFGFDTTADVNAATDVVTETAHGYATEDPIHYMKQGGTANMGLTDDTTYYVRAVTSDTIAFYTSAANATADTSRIALASTGSETHYINPIDAVVYNNSAGAVTINVVGGTPPTVRNGASATTTVNNSVNLEVNGVVQNTQCYIVPTAGGASLMNESASELVSGSEYKATQSYNYSTDTDVTIRTRELGYLPFETSGSVDDGGLTVTAVWQVDPNFKFTVTGIAITFTNATSLITRASGNFTTDGWLSIMGQVTVEGSTNNDGTYELSAVGTTTATITGASLTDEGPSSGITLTFTRRAATW